MLERICSWKREFRVEGAAATFLLVGYIFIPIAPAPVNLALFFSLLSAGFSRRIRERYKALFRQKVFICFFVLYAVLLLSSLYGAGSWILKLHYLGKYLEIGYMPLLAAIIYKRKYRDATLRAFSLVMIVTLIASYLGYFGIHLDIPNLGWSPSGPAHNPTVFKLEITHNFFMAFAVFLWLQGVLQSKNNWEKFSYLLLFLLGSANIFWMVGGRTGYLTFFSLIFVLLIEKITIKRGALGFFIFLITITFIYQYVPKFHNQIHQGLTEMQNWTPNVGSTSSIGIRLDFWNSSLRLIQDSPIFGSGIAGYEEGYKKIQSGSNLAPSVNPHNQYLLFLAQIGWFGLFVFGWLNYVIWVGSYRLERSWGLWVRGIVLGYATANIFNSLLLDFSEGIFFSASLAIAFSTLLDNDSCNRERELV